ncbi:MAG: IPT/TIG domain-containing protein [Candidatus Omnitrophota bacterium]
MKKCRVIKTGLILLLFLLGVMPWTGCDTQPEPGSPIQISTLNALSLLPSDLLTITGSGFDPTRSIIVEFYTNQGFSFKVEAWEKTATSLTVSVPPYIRPDNGALDNGVVNVRVIQGSFYSNTLPGFEILEPPALFDTPGNVTLQYLGGMLNYYREILNDSGSIILIPNEKNAIDLQIQQLQSLGNRIEQVYVNPGFSFSFGRYNGQDITIDSRALTNLDRLLMSFIAVKRTLYSPNPCYIQFETWGEGLVGFNPLQWDTVNPENLTKNAFECEAELDPTPYNRAVSWAGGLGSIGIGMLRLFGTQGYAPALSQGSLLYVTTMGIADNLVLDRMFTRMNSRRDEEAVRNTGITIDRMLPMNFFSFFSTLPEGDLRDIIESSRIIIESLPTNIDYISEATPAYWQGSYQGGIYFSMMGTTCPIAMGNAPISLTVLNSTISITLYNHPIAGARMRPGDGYECYVNGYTNLLLPEGNPLWIYPNSYYAIWGFPELPGSLIVFNGTLNDTGDQMNGNITLNYPQQGFPVQESVTFNAAK